MGDGDRGREPKSSARLEEVRERVQRAAKLIADLREANYSLSGELATLKMKLRSLEAERVQPKESAAAPSKPAVHEELQILRDERKIIRARVQSLLEKIDKIEV